MLRSDSGTVGFSSTERLDRSVDPLARALRPSADRNGRDDSPETARPYGDLSGGSPATGDGRTGPQWNAVTVTLPRNGRTCGRIGPSAGGAMDKPEPGSPAGRPRRYGRTRSAAATAGGSLDFFAG